MLRTRILTASVLLTVFVGALAILPATGFSLAVAAVAALAAWEWGRLFGDPPWVVCGVVIAFMVAVGISGPAAAWVVVAGVLWWIWSLLELSRPLDGGIFAGRLARAVLMLVPAWYALAQVRLEGGIPLTLALFAVVWSADIGAYFTGKRWGRRRLAVKISPGKTVEGALGGMLAVAVVALFTSAYFRQTLGWPIWVWLSVCMVAGLFSIVGDLAESRAKRVVGKKDSGAILPGHGGVLDRVDGMLAAAPVFALGAGLCARVSW